MLWRRTTIAAVLLAIASGGAGAAEPVRTLAWGILRIGTYFVNPPFEYMADGADIGFEVDLMEEIARRVGLKPAFVNTRWEAILQEMQDGRYDCIVGGITITPQREQILAWSVPYITTTLSLVVSGAKTPTIRGLADLKDASVGVQAAAIVSTVVVAARFIWLYPATYLPRWLFPSIKRRDPSPPWQWPFVLAFTGVRGIVSLAAALAIPFATTSGQPFPDRDLILFLTFSVILVTLVGQGLLLPSTRRTSSAQPARCAGCTHRRITTDRPSL